MKLCNTPLRDIHKNIRRNARRKWVRWITPRHSGGVVIVGGGPSIRNRVDEIRELQRDGLPIWALNEVHDYLLERGVTPDAMVMLDALRASVCMVQNPRPGVDYIIASRCNPRVFTALRGHKVFIWTVNEPGVDSVMRNVRQPWFAVGGGGTVGLRAMNLAYLLGYTRLHLYGLDSSLGGGTYAYDSFYDTTDEIVSVSVGGRSFRCFSYMAQQAEDFVRQYELLARAGCSIATHGEGLIPHLAGMIDPENLTESLTALHTECTTGDPASEQSQS